MERIFFACDGNDALSILNDECIDLAVLDIGLPGFSGIDICRRMKKDERLKGIPVIIYSSQASRDDVVEAIQAGANGFLGYPFSVSDVEDVIRKALSKLAGKA